jgi:fatty acid desaturase
MSNGAKLVPNDVLRDLSGRSNLMGAWLLIHAWGVIVLAVAIFAAFPNPLTFLFAVMIIGSRQLGLAIIMHEAAHAALFKTKTFNEFAGQWLAGAPILADMSAYRRYHLKHHRYTQTDEDPDLVLSLPFPTTRASLLRKFFRDLTGQTGIRLLVGRIVRAFQLAGEADAIEEAQKQNLTDTNDLGSFVKALAVNIGIVIAFGIAGFAWNGSWWWGLSFWLLPLLTWFQLVVRVRNIAEHAATERSDDPLRNTRTTLANPIARAFIAPYWVNYHLEHHVAMYVPCFRLPKLHAILRAGEHGERMRVAKGYGAVLKKAGWDRHAPAAADS